MPRKITRKMDIGDYINRSTSNSKHEALRDVLIKMVDHRTLIACNDELTESTRIDLCEGIDGRIESIIELFED